MVNYEEENHDTSIKTSRKNIINFINTIIVSHTPTRTVRVGFLFLLMIFNALGGVSDP